MNACMYCPTSVQIARQMRHENGQEVVERARARRPSYSSIHKHAHSQVNTCAHTIRTYVSKYLRASVFQRNSLHVCRNGEKHENACEQSTPESTQALPTRKRNTPQTTAAPYVHKRMEHSESRMGKLLRRRPPHELLINST